VHAAVLVEADELVGVERDQHARPAPVPPHQARQHPGPVAEVEARAVHPQSPGAELFVERVAAVARALSPSVNSASFQGTFVSFSDVSGIRSASGPGRPHPPIWVGGASDAAVRRAVRFGDAWHPNRFTVSWLREDGIPRLERFAADAGRPVPALCPRLRFRITDSPVTDPLRQAGTGTLPQLHEDFTQLEALGVQHVILDWYTDDLDLTRRHEWGWRMFATMAEKVFDLSKETVR